jgi:hypothetical protein
MLRGRYSEFDAQGVPTHFAATGVALTDKERQALGKDIKGRQKAAEALQKKVQQEGVADGHVLLANLSAEISELEAKIEALVI